MAGAIASCIQERGNWSKMQPSHRFDHPSFNPSQFKADLEQAGPKLAALVAKIAELDAADLAGDGKLYKHFIYSDIKSAYGAKLIASALAAAGFKHAYALASGKRGKTFKLGKEGQANTFATLTSVSFFDRPIGVQFRRELLGRFNARPDNLHGENVRLIILDSGFREGVDLFDIKYAQPTAPRAFLILSIP